MEKSVVRPGYKFDHVNCRIIITRDFHKKANVFGSEEYKTLQKLRKALPNYAVVFTAPYIKQLNLLKNHIKLLQYFI